MLKIIDDYEPSLEELQKMVGRNIQIITLKNGDFLVFNEAQTSMRNRKHNNEATKIYQEQGGMRGMDIVGMAVVVKKGLWKYPTTLVRHERRE